MLNKKEKHFFHKKHHLVYLLIFVVFFSFAVLGYSLQQFIASDATDASESSVFSEVASIIKNCEKLSYKEYCYADQLYGISKRNDLVYAKNVLTSLQKEDPIQSRGCHLMGHKIAYAEMEKDPTSWKTLLQSQDPNFCTGGFMHGVLEAHMRYDSTFTLNAQTFPVICSNVKNVGNGMLSCKHILGHLLLVEKQGNIKQAVAVCGEVEDYASMIECLSGSFMENITRLNLIDHGLAKPLEYSWKEAAKIEDMCRGYAGLAEQACWKELSYMYITLNNSDPNGVYTSCNRAPEQVFRDECYLYGVGNLVVYSTFQQKNLPYLCDKYTIDDPLYDRCVSHVIGAMLTSSPDFIDRTDLLCQSVYPSYQKQCYTHISFKLNTILSLEQRQQYCTKINNAYQEVCLNPGIRKQDTI